MFLWRQTLLLVECFRDKCSGVSGFMVWFALNILQITVGNVIDMTHPTCGCPFDGTDR